MRRVWLRLSMAIAGLSLLLLYTFIAAAGYQLVLIITDRRPDPVRIATYFVVVTLAAGYVSYRLGISGLLRDLDVVEIGPVNAPAMYAPFESVRPAFDVEEVSFYVAGLGEPNALAIGTARGGAIVVDIGLFRLLSRAELETIIAHELAHLEGSDGLIQTLGYTAVRTISGVCFLVLLAIGLLVGGFVRALSWLRGTTPRPFLIHLAVVQQRTAQVVAVLFLALTLPLRAHSRRREYAADDRAVEATGNPIALARALVKIQRAATPGWGILASLYVHGDEEGSLSRLLSTHPPMGERIERLVRRANERDARAARSERALRTR